MLTALAIKLRWYAEVLSYNSQNLKTYPTISAKCSIQIKINLPSRFDMIWCSPEARGRNTARTTTQEQSLRLNCAMFQLCVKVCGHARCLWAKFSAQPHTSLCIQSFVEENNSANNRLPLGLSALFSRSWIFFKPLFKPSCEKCENNCVEMIRGKTKRIRAN